MSARDRITSWIADQARRYPDFDLSSLDVSGLDDRDAALARAMEMTTLRRWLTLVTILDNKLAQPWEGLQPAVKAPLLVGAAQLLLLEKIPDHAAINEAVNWTKRHARARAGGLVNAILRRVAELRQEVVEKHDPSRADELALHDGRAWRLKENVFDEDPVTRIAQQTSHPRSLIQRWIVAFGRDQAESLAYHNLMQPPIIISGVDEDSAQAQTSLLPHEKPGYFLFTGTHVQLTTLLASREGKNVRVQDPTTAEPVQATHQMNPHTIIDFCAGMGTKTGQLAAKHPDARVITTDKNPARFEILQRTFDTHRNVEVVPFDRIREFDNQADLLLLDVPCSNSGVLARRVEAKYRFTGENLENLVGLQRQIIADSLPLLSENGRILYTTCSVEEDENQRQVEWLTRWHPLKVVSSALRMPSGVPGDPVDRYTDGGFHALLERI